MHDFLETIEEAKQSLEQTKEIVNDTKQTANDEKIDTEKNISKMTYFKKFLQNDESSDIKSSFIQDETSTDSGSISANLFDKPEFWSLRRIFTRSKEKSGAKLVTLDVHKRMAHLE